MRIEVNTIHSDIHGFNQLAKIHSMTKDCILEEIVLDFSNCVFFEANMSAPLQVLISRLWDDLNDVDFLNITAQVKKILQKNHFLESFGYENLVDSNQTTIPYKSFKLEASPQFYDYLENYMNERGIPKMSTILKKRFNQSIFELFQNSSLHSFSDSGIFTCGQFFPQKHRLDFSIADAGIGIRENVRRFTGNNRINSCSAIEWALMEGHTTKSGNQPGGLGLKLIKDFIHKNKGKLQIISNFGYYEFTCNGDKLIKMDFSFPGTCVNIEINTQDNSHYYMSSERNKKVIF